MRKRIPVPLIKCGTCHRPFQPRRWGQKYCSDTCKYRNREAHRAERIRPFVALDGEASGDNYCLLAASNGKLITDRAGLDTETCLDFLLSFPQGRYRPIYVGFAVDYDVNMILGDLDWEDVETLRTTNEVVWRGYHLKYFKRKIFRVSRGKRSMTLYDLWSFFATSFEQALKDWDIEVPEVISEGKAARGTFADWSMAKIQAYNDAELVALVELAEKLRQAIMPLGLPIRDWHGPGALANAWLQKNKVKRWLKPIEDERMQDMANRAYFGGRIDVSGFGIVEPVYHYDIVSAYPAAIKELPDLSTLEWKQEKVKELPRGEVYAAEIEWDLPYCQWAPFPWREPDGSIRYPLIGHGWYWWPEIEAALDCFPKGSFKVNRIWRAVGEVSYPFHDLIAETFSYRNELKQMGNPSHVAVKLILNSLYGKFAQTVGKARYNSPVWAGLITSSTRAKLMRALSNDVVCVMTDSIWSRAPLPLPTSTELGGWEQQPEVKLILAEAGLYQAIRPNGEVFTWQRGFDKTNTIELEKIVLSWLTRDIESPFYEPAFNVHRFVGMGLASQTSHPWRKWVDIQRGIHPVPDTGTSKRLWSYAEDHTPGANFIELAPRYGEHEGLSYPYKKLTLSNELRVMRAEEDCVE